MLRGTRKELQAAVELLGADERHSEVGRETWEGLLQILSSMSEKQNSWHRHEKLHCRAGASLSEGDKSHLPLRRLLAASSTGYSSLHFAVVPPGKSLGYLPP